MKKDKEWLISILKEKESFFDNSTKDSFEEGLCHGFHESRLLVEEFHDEPEKPVVPKFVADWIEKNRDKTTLLDSKAMMYQRYIHDDLKVLDWVDANEDLFIRAWLDGYTVSKEKRYRLRLVAPVLTTKKYLNKLPGGKRFFLDKSSNREFYQTIFTEKELEDIDETGFEREEVEEEE